MAPSRCSPDVGGHGWEICARIDFNSSHGALSPHQGEGGGARGLGLRVGSHVTLGSIAEAKSNLHTEKI